jgi:chemotaxis protein CheX
MTDPQVQDRLPFSLQELEGMVLESVTKYFDMMIGLSVQYEGCKPGLGYDELEGPPPPVLPSTKTVIVGMVGFVGAMNGVINLYMEEDLAMRITGSFLGMNEEELAAEGAEVVHDALGEMANMVVGTFKNAVSDKGFQCRMTVPSILRGTNFTIETPSSVFRMLYSFKIMNAPFIADLTMKPGD